MRKLMVALLGLGACYAWPTVENPDYAGGDGGSSSDGGVPSSSACPPGGVAVRTAGELQSALTAALAGEMGTEPLICLSPASYSFTAPIQAGTPTLGSVYLPPIVGTVTLLGLGSSPAQTELVGRNANMPTLDPANLRCPTGSARFFFVRAQGHLKLTKISAERARPPIDPQRCQRQRATTGV